MKLRQQQTHCKEVAVFIQTNPHRLERPQYMRSITIELESASSNTTEIIRYVMKGLELIFKEGFHYMKGGVTVSDLVPEQVLQQAIFDQSDRERNKQLMHVMDEVNLLMGKETVRMAVQGSKKKCRRRADHLSRNYTTNIQHILKVN